MYACVCMICCCCCCCCCSRRSVHMDGSPCANAITASGCSIRADSRGAAPPNSRIRLRAVAGHSWSQCSSVSGAPWQCGQVAEESASTMFRYAASLWQWPLRSWASRTESFLERETGARLPLKTALVLSWLMAGSIVSLFVKALAVWKVIPPSVAAGSSSEAATAPASTSAHSFPMSPIWPGTHCSETRVFNEFRIRRVSARSEPSLNPGDCSAVRVDWLSVQIMKGPWFSRFLIQPTASSIAVTSVS